MVMSLIDRLAETCENQDVVSRLGEIKEYFRCQDEELDRMRESNSKLHDKVNKLKGNLNELQWDCDRYKMVIDKFLEIM